MRAREKFQLSDLVDVVQKRTQFTQCHPQQLKHNIDDIYTLLKVSHSEFFGLATELRKKAAEKEKTLRESERQALQLQNLFANQPGANWQIAYNIFTLASPPFLKQHKTKLLKELKLAFLESYSVTFRDWNTYLRPQLNVLALKVPQEDAEVILGLTQQENKKTLEWTVFGATMGGVFSPKLWEFVKGVIKYNRQFKEEWRRYVISDIRSILSNLQGLIIYLQLRKTHPGSDSFELGYGQQRAVCSWEQSGKTIDAHWIFSFGENSLSTVFRLTISEKDVLELQFKQKTVKGTLKLISNEAVLNISIPDSLICSHQYLLKLPRRINEFQNSINKVNAKYPRLKNEPHSIFVRMIDRLWLADQLMENQCSEALKEGVWIHVPIKDGFLIQVLQDGSMSSEICEQGLIDDLTKKDIVLGDVCRHLRLFSKMKTDNEMFEYKLFELKYGKRKEDGKNYVIYEFRSNKFPSSQKHQRASRNQDMFTQLDNTSFDNFVLSVKVSFDFTTVQFSSWKYHQGPRTEAEKNNYLKDSWIKYRNGLAEGEKMSWQKLSDAIGYYCRCYLVERVRYRVFSDEDRRVNSMEFV